MRKYFGAATLVAALGAISSAMLSADMGIASAADATESGQTDIIVDPGLVNAQQADASGETEADDAEAGDSAAQDIVFISEPVVQKLVPENDEADQELATEFASLRDMVAAHDQPSGLSREQECLAGTVYFESKGESLAGQLAVAEVVLARRDSRRWPNSICGVVYQRSQFSFVRGGRMPSINKSSRAWSNAVAISQIALDGGWESPVKGSYFFHARYVRPGWRLQRVGSVDNHIFYR